MFNLSVGFKTVHMEDGIIIFINNIYGHHLGWGNAVFFCVLWSKRHEVVFFYRSLWSQFLSPIFGSGLVKSRWSVYVYMPTFTLSVTRRSSFLSCMYIFCFPFHKEHETKTNGQSMPKSYWKTSETKLSLTAYVRSSSFLYKHTTVPFQNPREEESPS